MSEDAAAEPVARAVERVAEHHPEIVFAYLYGSAARGQAHTGSDLDVAVLCDPAPDLLDEAGLAQEIARTLGGDSIDLLLLNTAPLWLRFRVVGEGRVLFSRDEARRVRFREETVHSYLDFRPYREAYLAAVRHRARTGRASRG